MANPKRHLRVASVRAVRAACGLVNPRFWSDNPAEVTCNGCRRTVQMADAEVAWRQHRQA